jgi:hypothetical protein
LAVVTTLAVVVALLTPVQAVAADSSGMTTAGFGVGGSCSGGQLCPASPADAGYVASYSDLTAVFSTSSAHCSDMALRIFDDGNLVATTPFAGPGKSTTSVKVPWPNNGSSHALGYEGEGRVGGCNVGNLVQWAGTLTVTYRSSKATLSVSVSLSRGSVAVGNEVGAAVTVSAQGSAVDDIDLGTGLRVSPSFAQVSRSAEGLSGFDLAAGASRTFNFELKGVSPGVAMLEASATGQTSSGSVQGSGSLSLTVIEVPPLSVSVSLSPSPVRLNDVPDDPASTDGAPVDATVTVTNTGKETVDDVHVVDQLTIGYDDHGPVVAVVPLRQVGVPTTADDKPLGSLGSLSPGETSKPVKFKLSANGDGGYSVEALATADKPGGGFLHGSGEGKLTVNSKLLELTAEGPDNQGALWPAGRPYTVAITAKDLSYRKSIVLFPRFQVTGNGQLGPLIGTDDDVPDQASASSCTPPQAVQLSPREEKKFKLVIYTSSVAASQMGGQGGGTRSTISINQPLAGVLDEAGDDIESKIGPDDVDLTPDAGTGIDVHLSDRGIPPYEPNSTQLVWGYINIGGGALEGIQDFAWGLISGLPKLVAAGIKGIPTILLDYWQFQAEAYQYMKDDPSLLATVDPLVAAEIKAMVAHAPALAKAAGQAVTGINKEMTSYLSNIYANWLVGNWQGAAAEMTKTATETGLTVASFIPEVGTCLMAKSSKFLGALNAARGAAFDKAAEAIGSLDGIIGWSTALEKLNDFAIGMRMTYQQLAQLYGLTPAQVNWLRTFAEENQVIITVRSRAAQAIKFLEEGAVLKPEQIKIKSVSWLDAQYLGYRQSNVGMVVLRSPISKEQLTANLLKGGVKEGSATWNDAFKLLDQRVSEFDHAPGGFTSGSGGYYKDLEAAAKESKITLRWNVEQNSVNPDVATNTYTEYNFRLHDDGDGNYLPQFQYEAAGPCLPPACLPGGWRSVTGDIDFLSMTDVNGKGLSAAKRVELYQKLAGNNPVHMLHPAADTWTIGDDFWFDDKENEFDRAGIVPQFTPNGSMPTAVKFNPATSYFKSADNYRVGFFSGYEGPLINEGQ